MKTLLTAIFATMALCSVSLTQQATSPPPSNSAPQTQSSSAAQPSAPVSAPQTSPTPRLAPGSVIPVQLTKSIDAKKMKIGDKVEAKVAQDLKAANGELIVAKDTKILGHVTEAQARTKEQKESQIGIAFDQEVLKNGTDMTLPMSIQAIIAPPSQNSENSNMGGESASRSTPGGSAAPATSRPSPGMGAGVPPAESSPSATTSATAGPADTTNGQASANHRQPITGNTQGVIGIANLNLSEAPDKTQGSLLSSEHNNVKVESGTFMLLRVNP